MLLHIILAHIYNNPTIAALSIAGMLLCWLGLGWCLRSLVVEWHIAHIGVVVRTAIGLHVGKCSLYFAREIVYS
jgi:hypothetical protein